MLKIFRIKKTKKIRVMWCFGKLSTKSPMKEYDSLLKKLFIIEKEDLNAKNEV